MPYVVGEGSRWAASATNALPLAIPPGHVSGDLLLLFVAQDVGTGTISVTGGGTWTEIGTQATANAQRMAVFYRYASSSNEDDASISSTLAGNAICAGIVVVRDAAGSSPIDAENRQSTSGTGPKAAATVTTTSDRCLVFHAFSADSGAWGRPDCLGEVTPSARIRGTAISLQVGYTYKATAGSTKAFSFMNSGVNGQVHTIAIKPNGSSTTRPPEIKKHAANILFYAAGTGGTQEPQLSSTTASALSTVAATVNGISTNTSATSLTATSGINNTDIWGPALLVQTLSNATDLWFGGVYQLVTTTSFSAKTLIAGFLPPTGIVSAPMYFVVVDDSGNWAFYRLAVFSQLPIGAAVNFAIDFDTATAEFTSATPPNLANITKFGTAYLIGPGKTTSSAYFLSMFLVDSVEVVGGCDEAPVTPAAIADMLNGWFASYSIGYGARYAEALGGSGLIRHSLTIGDGSTKTVSNFEGRSLGLPANYAKTSTSSFDWQVLDLGVTIQLLASSTDSVSLAAGSVVSRRKQKLRVNTGSSASATYNFKGLVVNGFEVENNVANVTFNDVTFSGCHQITLNGGGMNGCSVVKSLTVPAVETNNPADIANCRFISSGTGHAIEITQPGTYTFAGNTFEGYGADGTTDAAIYNNSGGLVTLNITGGGDTPTVRNGTGASTTVNNNVSITIEGLVAGSALRVERVSDNALMFENASTSTSEVVSVAGGTNYRIKVRKGTSAPKYQPFATQTGTLSGDTTVFVQQIPDLIAA